jgi:hypothetical protein
LTRIINGTFGTVFSKTQVAGFLTYYKYKTVYKHIHELPLNTERIKEGHIYIKVSMDGPYKQRWQRKSRWIWEQANGKIPAGMNIIFLDNNSLNCTLENLAIISKAEKFVMAQFDLYTDNPEVILAGIAVARHLLAIHSYLKITIGSEEHRRFVKRESARRIQERRKK